MAHDIEHAPTCRYHRDDVTPWHRYSNCDDCGAVPGEPCIKLVSQTSTFPLYNLNPHPGRAKVSYE